MRLVQVSVQCVLPDLYQQLTSNDLPHRNRTGSLYEAGTGVCTVQCVLPDLYQQLMGKDLPYSNRTGFLFEDGTGVCTVCTP